MNTKKIFLFKIFSLFLISLFLLSACGQSEESAEDIIQSFKEEVTEIESGDIGAEVVMKGTDGGDVIDFTADIDFKFDKSDVENKKTDINISLSGMMNTAEQSMDGDVELNILAIADNYYVLLKKLESTSESMESIEPVIKDYIGNWLHISDDFIPDNIKQLQQKDEATLEKEEKLKKLFVDTDLFIVSKEYGVETVNGVKVHHYGITFDEAGIQDYVRKAAVIDGRELTEAEIAEASKIASYMTNAELWIGVKDYYLYKATVDLSGGETEDGVDMSIAVSIEGSDYNDPIKVEAPEESQEFNPLELLMAYSTASMDLDEEVEVVEE